MVTAVPHAVLVKPPRIIVTADEMMSPAAIEHIRDVLDGWDVAKPIVVDGGLTLHFLDEDGRVVSTVPDSRPLEPAVIETTRTSWLPNVASIVLSVAAIVLVLLR